MSLHFISGKPGAGKSFYALKLLLEELRLTNRQVITNLSVKPGELAAFLTERYDDTFNLRERLHVLSEEQAAEFWRYRGTIELTQRRETVRTVKGGIQREEVLDFSGAANGGVFYVLDEVHLFFNSRNWMKLGGDCIYYLSQHRKLGDDILAVTQHVENVDKQFRSMAQDYTYIRNLSKERVGIFRGASSFLRLTFPQPANSSGVKCQETGLFKLDVTGLAQCYETAAGVGIHGRAGADKGERRKGLPLWILFALIVLLVVGLAAIPAGLGRMVRGGFKAKVEELDANASRAAQSHAEATKPVLDSKARQQSSGTNGPALLRKLASGQSVASAGHSGDTNRLRIVGFIGSPGHVLDIFLSNGERLHREDITFYDGKTVVDATGRSARW
jgi:hypothetical protein